MNVGSHISLGLSSGISSKEAGSTSTVKDQSQNIETSLSHMKKILENQRKQHNQLYLQLRKLQERAKGDFEAIQKQIEDQTNLTAEGFYAKNQKQSHQFQYLEMQLKLLHDEQNKLGEFCRMTEERVESVTHSVGNQI